MRILTVVLFLSLLLSASGGALVVTEQTTAPALAAAERSAPTALAAAQQATPPELAEKDSLALARQTTPPRPADEDSSALGICEGVVQLFKQHPGALWPGYDLAATPFIYYMPGKWALLLNHTDAAEDFGPYPDEWPKIGTDAQLHKGPYANLEGQLAFDLAIGDAQVAAVPYEEERSSVDRVAFLVHENFHQYQYDHFGEIPWEREELYPIDDRENTALAYVEMRLLMDALEAAKENDTGRCTARVKEFVAVRDHRWQRSDPFVARLEQGQELEEGTAKYVETKGVDLFARLEYSSVLGDRASALDEGLASINVYDYLLDEFRQRTKGNSVSPEDMPRNRIYPVACAQAILLDYFGIDWKTKAQEAGPAFTFAGVFEDPLGVEKSDFPGLLKSARDAYGYSTILAATDSLLREYEAGYAAELKTFEGQKGCRFEIELSSKNLRRSRTSTAKKWLVERGSTELRSHFDVYSLESASDQTFLLQVHDTGVLERNDWGAMTKKIVFFVPELAPVVVDGTELAKTSGRVEFESLEIAGEKMTFRCSKRGTIEKTDGRIVITLLP